MAQTASGSTAAARARRGAAGRAAALAACALAVAAGTVVLVAGPGRQPANGPSPDARIPIGVLGDSDSQSYHDRLWVAPGTPERGGAWRERTFQWIEVLARLRGERLDPGAWGVWGTGRTVARLRGWLGLPAGSPKKEDYRFNAAFAGAGCADLMVGARAQAPRLAALMDEQPARWRDGVVVIRIGINDLGRASMLDAMAREPDSAVVRQAVDACVGHVRAAVALLRARHPATRIVLVGILDNADWPGYFDRWQSPRELAHIAAALDRFDRALAAMVAADARMAFFDDRAWFAQRWGRRGVDGRPDAYRTVPIGPAVRIEHAAGDDPRRSVLADGHAGLAWNAMWAQSLVALLNDAFGMGIEPIAEQEVAAMVQAALAH